MGNDLSFNICTPLYGIAFDENHVCVKWTEGDVCFSLTQRGRSLSCHFSAKKNSLRSVKIAIDEFCAWAFDRFKWCDAIIAFVTVKSVGRLIVKTGFKLCGIVGNFNLFIRERL